MRYPEPAVLDCPGHIYRLRRVTRRRDAGRGRFRLEIPELDIRRGEGIAITGPSGSGKSTLLDMLAMTLRPSTAGHFLFCGVRPTLDVDACWRAGDRDRLAMTRRRHMGYVLQVGGLLPYLTVRDNIALSCRLLDLPAMDDVEALATVLEIDHRLDAFPAELSVGERQRAALARALAHRPNVVLADEPTASVDPIAADAILDHLRRLAEHRGATLIIVSHHPHAPERLGLRRLHQEIYRNENDGDTVAIFAG